MQTSVSLLLFLQQFTRDQRIIRAFDDNCGTCDVEEGTFHVCFEVRVLRNNGNIVDKPGFLWFFADVQFTADRCADDGTASQMADKIVDEEQMQASRQNHTVKSSCTGRR